MGKKIIIGIIAVLIVGLGGWKIYTDQVSSSEKANETQYLLLSNSHLPKIKIRKIMTQKTKTQKVMTQKTIIMMTKLKTINQTIQMTQHK